MANSIVTPKTFLAYSLGCRTNQAEIETISQQLIDRGFQPAKKDKQPDIVLLNTCIVTQKAEKETRQKTRELQQKYPKSLLVVLGCGVTAREKFKISFPEANLFISNEEKKRTVEIIEYKFCSTVSTTKNNFENKYILSGRKFIKIQDGCDKYCTYCITCHLRGKPFDISPIKVIKEINFWVERGTKEIILTGINLGLYHDITVLLKKILIETKIERISFSSIYPEMLTDDFIKTVVGSPRISQYFHLSLQSGSSSVLKRMNRKTDLKELLKKLNRIRKQNPLFTFRADLIVGFSDETEKEFQETIDLIRKARISFTHIFPFSPRKGTIASEMIKNKKWDEIAKDIKNERVEKIRNVVEKVRNNEAKLMIDHLFQCLIVRRKNGQWEGLIENGWLILVRSARSKIQSYKGKILPARITGFDGTYLLGEITSLPTK